MKSQLLADIGENNPEERVPPRVSSRGPVPPANAEASSPPEASQRDVRRDQRVWRERAEAAQSSHKATPDQDSPVANSSGSPFHHAAPDQHSPFAASSSSAFQHAAQGHDNTAAAFSFEPSFNSGQTDWLPPQQELRPSWYERWGRRVASWSLALVATVAAAGGGLWVYQQSKVEQTLALVADNAVAQRQDQSALTPGTSARPEPAPAQQGQVQASAASAATGTADSSAPSADPSQALVLLQEQAPTQVPAAPAVGNPDTTNEASSRTDTVDAAPAADPPDPRAITPAKKQSASPRKEAPPQRAKATAQARPAQPEPQEERGSQLAETLKQCRAAGYHAELCLERKCVATKYGLACKG